MRVLYHMCMVKKYTDISLLTQKQYKTLSKLDSAKKIQSYLDTYSINHEKNGETYMSVKRTMEAGVAHCLEGALLAALAFWIHGKEPLIMDLKSNNGDDHIVALYKEGGRWGAVSKTNHATLRFRDPVYKTVRELAMSYFHEYIHLKTGEKILVSFSTPLDLRNIKRKGFSKEDIQASWISGSEDLFWLAGMLDVIPHEEIYPKKNKKYLRKADTMELKAGNLLEWK